MDIRLNFQGKGFATSVIRTLLANLDKIQLC